MTTGSRVTDYRYDSPFTGVKSLGMYNSRVWTGTDWSPATKVARRLARATRPDPWRIFVTKNWSFLYESTDERQIIARHHELHERWSQQWRKWLDVQKAYHAKKAEDTKRRNEEPHPYNMSLNRFNNTPAGYQVWHNPSKTFLPLVPNRPAAMASIIGYPVPPEIWNTNDDNALIEKFRSKLTSVDGFHGGVAAAELEKTLKMIADTAKTLRRFGQRASAGDWPGALRVLYNGSSSAHVNGLAGLSKGASNYLAYQFGLKPLYEDMKGLGEYLAYCEENPKFQRVRVTRLRYQLFDHIGNSGGKCPSRIDETGRIVAYLKRMPSRLDLSGLTDLPSMLWERGYLSFVVDWWIPIGNTLQAMQMARNLEGVFVTTRRTLIRNGPFQSGPTIRVWDDSSTRVTLTLKRTVSSSLVVKLPSLKPIFHPLTEVRIRHANEAAALMLIKRKSIISAAEKLHEKASAFVKPHWGTPSRFG
ncbi:TPA_asm: maturation protein [ssRNA phage SRR6960799_18]|uniref:Maturation protein n=1 Tax=ssRNA phage SRR6960799_18 TaxID=2786574 RepID=A0A8S5KXZ1_9VIRU|nr:maturation protein [ssRNA phage SRR6960799_18]DAD50646.1 TPA_asm: maturation protein [ssRNA phage SRR6960799_18]